MKYIGLFAWVALLLALFAPPIGIIVFIFLVLVFIFKIVVSISEKGEED